MANELNVDASGLRVAAATSEGIAAELASGFGDGARGTTPSQAGVAVILAAAQSVRTRQSDRIRGQAGDLTTSIARYDTADVGGADAITAVSV